MRAPGGGVCQQTSQNDAMQECASSSSSGGRARVCADYRCGTGEGVSAGCGCGTGESVSAGCRCGTGEGVSADYRCGTGEGVSGCRRGTRGQRFCLELLLSLLPNPDAVFLGDSHALMCQVPEFVDCAVDIGLQIGWLLGSPEDGD